MVSSLRLGMDVRMEGTLRYQEFVGGKKKKHIPFSFGESN